MAPSVVTELKGAGGPVEHLSVGAAAEVGVHEDAITGGVDAWGGSPARALERRAAELTAGGADGADPIGEVFAVGVADREDRDVLGAVSVGVCDCCVRERVASLEWCRVFVFPAVAASDRLALVDVAGAQSGQGALFGGVALAAVLDQGRPRDDTVGCEALDFGDQAAGGDRLGLVGRRRRTTAAHPVWR